jgi:hypothetical protein
MGVVVPNRRLNLGPHQLPQQFQLFFDGVVWLSMEELGPRRIRRTFELQAHRVELTGVIDLWPQEVA